MTAPDELRSLCTGVELDAMLLGAPEQRVLPRHDKLVRRHLLRPHLVGFSNLYQLVLFILPNVLSYRPQCAQLHSTPHRHPCSYLAEQYRALRQRYTECALPSIIHDAPLERVDGEPRLVLVGIARIAHLVLSLSHVTPH